MMAVLQKVALMLIEDRAIWFAQSRGKKFYYCLGGKIEPGETELQALIREVREEGGIEILDPIEKMATLHGPADGGGEMDMHCFKCREYYGTLQASGEIKELKKLTSADIGTGTTTVFGDDILRWLHHDLDLID